MKVRSYERSALWRSAFSKKRNDPDELDRTALAAAFRELRDRAGMLVGEIHSILPQLTVHDLTHADTLWDVASEICGPEITLNPLEGFVLGASFLLHDAGMALAAYPNGLKDLENSAEWRDAVVSAWKKKGVEEPTDAQRAEPDKDIHNEAIFQVLRSRHASQAKTLATAIWTHPATGTRLALVPNDDLLDSYGELIGNISASHHWPLSEVARYFGDPTPASAAWPREWEVNGLFLACLLRCADACAIDETRAPSFLFAIRNPSGESKRHWAFQNKIYPAKRRDDALIFECKSPFLENESDDWWLCYDAIEIADTELRGSDALLTDRHYQPFATRRIIGAGDPAVLIQSIRVEGWKPVNTQPKISNPQSVIERLGGKALYGDRPIVPIRELIQNSVDAIRARRFLDVHFGHASNRDSAGLIAIEIRKIEDTSDYWIAVEDDGIGMSERVMTQSLLDFGNSFWSSATAAQLYPGLPSEKSFRPIGKFGIGFFSIFMYSDVATVMSHEFRGARDVWNILSFKHGVRARGNFSVGKTPDEIIHPDASTRIKIRVNRQFLFSLAEIDRRLEEIENETDLMLEKSITSKVAELVCALDVPVQYSFLGMTQAQLNDPPIYEKDSEYISRLLGNENLTELQKRFLVPLGSSEDRFYGYCGLNVTRSAHATLKSVGGLVNRERFGSREDIVGIAEYKVTTANREPDALAAPQEVIDAWVKEQIARVLCEPLSGLEREHAAYSLGNLGRDIRPIFAVTTSEGVLNLEETMFRFLECKAAIIPAERHGAGGIEYYYFSLPDKENGLYLGVADIEFNEFSLCPSWSDHFAMIPGQLKPDVVPGDYSSFWSTIINTLRDRSIGFKLSFRENFELGKYTGLDSLRHNIKNGDVVAGGAVKLTVDAAATDKG
jgi:hypothetical protein